MKKISTLLGAVAVATALSLGAGTSAVASAPSATATVRESTSATTVKPKITTQPKSANVVSGTVAKFTVKAKGSSLKYQWYYKKVSSSKWIKSTAATAKKSTFKVKATTKNSGYKYRVVVSNKKGKVTSATVKLTTQSKPKISKQPKPITTITGKKVTFSVAATGNSLKYQWQRYYNGSWSNLDGATKSTLTFTAKSKLDLTEYRVVIKNEAGRTVSKAAGLFVDSSMTDPMKTSTWFSLYNWQAKFGSTEQDTVEADPGYTDLYVDFELYNWSDGSRFAGDDLFIFYAGSDGELYDRGEYTYAYGVDSLGATNAGNTTSASEYAMVPSAVVKGGNWVVFDSSGDVIQYVVGVR